MIYNIALGLLGISYWKTIYQNYFARVRQYHEEIPTLIGFLTCQLSTLMPRYERYFCTFRENREAKSPRVE